MYSISNANNYKHKKNFFIKKKDLNFIGFPKIHFPFLQKKQLYFNTLKDTKIIKKYYSNLSLLKNNSSGDLKINEKILKIKSGSGNNMYNLIQKNKKSSENVLQDKNVNNSVYLNNISNYNSLLSIWNDFSVSKSYKNFFNLILNKLSEEEREDICLKEYKELSELKNNIISLIKEIQFRKESLEKLFQLNNLLNKDLITEINVPDNTIMKQINEQIANLRLHSVNICFKIKKIKNKIYEGHIYGKYDLDAISKKFGFDKDYLIKMKEEMIFLKKGKINKYFKIGRNPDPFLINCSENVVNSNNDTSFYFVPMSKELEESIKQCNYFIYQELINYQTNNNKINSLINTKEDNLTKNYQHKEMFNESISEKDYKNNNIDSIKFNEDLINTKENNTKINIRKYSALSDRLERVNRKEKDESILFEENRINMNDIINEKNNNKNDLNKQKSNKKNSDKKLEKLSDSRISRMSNLTSNATKRSKLNTYSNKKLKLMIYEGYIHYFEQNYFHDYFKLIPQQEIKMFNLQKQLSPNIINGIAPFIILIKEENNNNKKSNEKDNIFGCCAFNYMFKKNKLKIKISHISAIIDYNYTEYKENMKIIYQNLLNFIINGFYFDELFIEYFKKDLNEEIMTIFKELGFFEKTLSNAKNHIKSNCGEEPAENGQIKLNYLVYKNQTELNNIAKNSLLSFYGNNLFNIFNSILLCNTDKELNYNGNDIISKEMQDINNLKYKNSEIFINLSAIENLFQSNSEKNISKLYKRISSLDELMKIFLSYKIDKSEIPLSAAENRFNIVGFVLDKIINNILINTPKLINNYSFFTSDSFLDENSGIYYNFMKSNSIYELSDENLQISFYFIVNDSYAIFFVKFDNQMIENEILNTQNLYNQINDILREFISNNQFLILKNKIIWIPCFLSYKHLKCLINNTFFTVHEYIQVSNKIINTYERKKREKVYELFFQNSLNSFLIEPQINDDILIDNNFIIGIINNAEIFNKININKIEDANINKERIISAFSSKNKGEITNNKEDNKDSIMQNKENEKALNINLKEFPNILFLNYIKKSDFIQA